MQFLFNGDIRRPVVIAIEAKDSAQAMGLLIDAEKRGNLEGASISVYDEDLDPRLARFDWDGEETEMIVEEKTKLILVSDRLRA